MATGIVWCWCKTVDLLSRYHAIKYRITVSIRVSIWGFDNTCDGIYGKRYETMVNKWWDRSDWWMLDWPRHRYNEIKSGVIIELFCAVTDGKWDRVTGVYICLLLMWLITRRTTSTSYGVMSLLTGLSSQSPPIICKARGGGVANDWRWLSLVHILWSTRTSHPMEGHSH